jgi:hypothetical protein
MPSDIEITITNPDGQTVKPVMVELPQFDEYLDKPRKFVVAIEKSSGLDPQGTARVTRRGKIILLGHIKKLDQTKLQYDTLTLMSAEALLDERIGQFYRYPAATRLDAILASSMGGSVVGLLAMANGLIPRGSWVLHSGSVYKIVGAGTSSARFGNLTALYQGATLLTKTTAIPTASGQWWQSSTDLYIWTTDSKSPLYHLIIAPNFKDTLMRLGTISLASTTFSVCYEIGENKLFPGIKALILAGGLEYSIRYEKDGYAYLDASATVGQGSSSAPVATYREGDNAEISQDEIDGYGHIQALIGQGAGTGISQQSAAALDLTLAGTWREGVYRAGGLFGEMLQAATDKVFSDYADPIIYNVKAEQDWSQAVGNYVGIVREGSQPVIKRIKHISQRNGQMALEVGQRLRTLQELLKAEEEVQNILSSFYGSHTKNAWSWSLPETNIDSYEAITHSFLLQSTDKSGSSGEDDSLGDGEIDPNFPFQVILSLSVDWYKSATYSATQQNDLHSNVGSHGGYGGGTNAKPMTAHGVNSITDLAATQYVNVLNGVYSAGNHSHSVSNTANSRSTGSGGSPAHSHYYTDYSAYGSSYGGDHYHSGAYYPVSSSFHQHTIPSHYTNDAASQDHAWGTGGGSGGNANPRAGSIEHPVRQSILEGLIKKYGTGNSIHYLTLTVKVNGVQVPGSPFSGAGGTGLYIGDSIDAIDISDLVTVGAQNTIELSISEFGGSDVVRCSLSGNVNVSAIISAF